MSKLLALRERLNLTQEELAAKSTLSVRTIQRIEAGQQPKGYTLKVLSEALEIDEDFFNERTTSEEAPNITFQKLINLSSLIFTVFPPANIIVPLIIMFVKKQFDPLSKQIISVQILWTILSIILFMLSAFTKNWFSWSNQFTLVVMIVLVLSNVFIILRNTAELDRKGKLYFQLNFNII